MKTYKVLKDWGDFKAGETFVPSEHTEVTDGDISNLLADGTLEEVIADNEQFSDYKVLADDGITFEGDDHSIVKGVIFSAQPHDPQVIQFIADGKLALVTDQDNADAQAAIEKDVADQEAKAAVDAAAAAEGGTVADDAAAQKRFNGQLVVVDGSRTIEDREYHHIRLEDGTEYDLTDAEYAEQVA